MKSQLEYSKEGDILYLAIEKGKTERTFKIIPGIVADLNDEGEVVGVEILDASKFIKDMILDSVQAKIFLAEEGVKIKRRNKKEEVKDHGRRV